MPPRKNDSQVFRGYLAFAFVFSICLGLAIHFSTAWIRRTLNPGLSPATLNPATCEFAFFLRPLMALLKRPYWNRTWIVQELALAQRLTLWCGGDSIAWSQFTSVFLSLELDTLPRTEVSIHTETIWVCDWPSSHGDQDQYADILDLA